MPPKGKLEAAAVDRVSDWVKHGAIVPAAPGTTVSRNPAGQDFESARRHWAYQPIRSPAIPATRDRDWPRSPIDSFVLARLEAAGLTSSPPADRRTLLRRAYLT